MNPNSNPESLTTRREFLKTTGRVAAASALAGVVIPHVHAAENNTIQLALIGCGGRGTGAANQALSTEGNVKLIAMADAYQDRLESSYKTLLKQGNLADRIDVPEDRKFVGFDAYQKALDAGPDLVILVSELPHANDASGGRGKLLRREIRSRWGSLLAGESAGRTK